MVSEESRCQLATAADPDLGEYRLERVLDSVLGDTQVERDTLGRLALESELCDLALALGEPVREQDDRRQLKYSSTAVRSPRLNSRSMNSVTTSLLERVSVMTPDHERPCGRSPEGM